ncbi:MAG: hypothetical protein GWP09_03000 [Nitrospiraceae bacterium]|nr:hypothetical protein [Nitrospiraceae bacterium]
MCDKISDELYYRVHKSLYSIRGKEYTKKYQMIVMGVVGVEMKNLFLVVGVVFSLLLLSLGLSGCNHQSKIDSGLELSIANPNHYYKVLVGNGFHGSNSGASDLGYMRFFINNYGPVKVNGNDIVVVLKGFDPKYVTFSDDSSESDATTRLISGGVNSHYASFRILDDVGGASMDSDGNLVPYQIPFFIDLKSQPVQDPNVRSYDLPLAVDLCYSYKTDKTGSICLDKHPYDGMKKNCNFGAVSFSKQNNHFPIIIKSISADVLTNGFSLTVTIENAGKGYPISDINNCGFSPLNEQNRINKLNFKIFNGQTYVDGDCSPDSDLGLNTQNLGVFNCYFDDQQLFGNVNSATEFSFNITLNYDYMVSKSSNIKFDYVRR